MDDEDFLNNEKKKRIRTYKTNNPTTVIVDGWCHQCKIKNNQLMVCINFWKKKKGGRCNGKYSPKCIEKHYKDDIENLIKLMYEFLIQLKPGYDFRYIK